MRPMAQYQKPFITDGSLYFIYIKYSTDCLIKQAMRLTHKHVQIIPGGGEESLCNSSMKTV